GALVYQNQHTSQVAYNLLTPHMQQFMGRCIGAIKKTGVSVKGTAQFSVLINPKEKEIHLSQYYQPDNDPAHVERVVAAAKGLLGGAGNDSSMPRAAQSFYSAPFTCNGKLVGIGERQLSALSDRWLDFSRQILRDGGESFSSLLHTPFERVALRF